MVGNQSRPLHFLDKRIIMLVDSSVRQTEGSSEVRLKLNVDAVQPPRDIHCRLMAYHSGMVVTMETALIPFHAVHGP